MNRKNHMPMGALILVLSGCGGSSAVEEAGSGEENSRSSGGSSDSDDAPMPGTGGSDQVSDRPTSGGNSGQKPNSGGSPTGGSLGTGGSTGDPNRHVIPDGAVTVVGRALTVNGTPIHIRGVCWNPVVKGGTHPDDLDYGGLGELDIPLIRAAGINVVRTYTEITDEEVLDALHAAGIKVIMSVYAWGGVEPSAAVPIVNAVKDHPAIFMWLVGNEWNYNGLYVDLSFDESLDRVQEAAQLIKEADPGHLVATAYGEVPSADTIARLSAVDVWGINSYRGISFGDLFSTWETLSSLPMFLSEYGADAYDSRGPGGVNLDAQAEATAALAGELETHAARSGGVTSGGTIFEWSDEWWKDASGDPNVQDVGGIAPGGGPHPDLTFNEEWWGVVTIDREIRPAYTALQSIFLTP